MSKRKRNYSDIDNPYIPSMTNAYRKHKIEAPAETPFSIDGCDSNSVIYADDYYYNNRHRLGDNMNNIDIIPVLK